MLCEDGKSVSREPRLCDSTAKGEHGKTPILQLLELHDLRHRSRTMQEGGREGDGDGEEHP